MVGRQFRFRLNALLRMKQQLLEQQESMLRRASLELQTARRRVTEIETTIARETESLRDGGRVELAAVMHAATAWEARLVASRQQCQTAEQNWRHANDQYRALSHELAAMTKLRDRQFADFQQDHARAEQKELDEVVLRKWIQEGRSPKSDADDSGIACDLTETK